MSVKLIHYVGFSLYKLSGNNCSEGQENLENSRNSFCQICKHPDGVFLSPRCGTLFKFDVILMTVLLVYILSWALTLGYASVLCRALVHVSVTEQ